MERTRLQDFVIGLVVLLVGICGVVSAVKMPEGTRPYTVVVMGIFAFMGAILTFRSIRYRKVPSADATVVHAAVMKNPVIAFFMVFAYAILLDIVGFFVTSAVFMLIMMRWMGYKKIITMVLTTVIMLSFIYTLFIVQLNVTLPRGVLF